MKNILTEQLMKKIALSSALLAISGLASAQSSVTLFGIIDAALQRGSGSVADRTQLGSGANSSSRLGFRGVEDLGGGMSASFWLEAAVLVDTGAGGPTSTNNQPSGTPATLGGTQGLTFARRSTVSLTSSLGELRLGRDYSAHYYRYIYDPFGNNGVGASQTFLGAPTTGINRVSNQIAYHLPSNLGGIYGLVEYHLGENASNAGATKNDGNGGGVRLGWNGGPFDVSLTQARTSYASTATLGDITSTTIGARYDFSVFSVMGQYVRDKVDTAAAFTGRGGNIAGVWRVGAGEVKAMWSQYGTTAAAQPETKKLSLGYVHNLSKRTAIYGSYARVRNSGGATVALNGSITGANQSSSGVDLGIRHAF
nr:porin [Alicycliphilus denitrificans]